MVLQCARGAVRVRKAEQYFCKMREGNTGTEAVLNEDTRQSIQVFARSLCNDRKRYETTKAPAADGGLLRHEGRVR
jgi:hypothetical protein